MDTDDLGNYSSEQIWAHLAESENEEKVDLLIELYHRSYRDSDYAQAASLAEQAAVEAAKCKSNLRVENAYYKQGIALSQAERYEEAIAAYTAGINCYQEPDSKVELSKNQWGVAAALYDSRKFEEAVDWAHKSADSAASEEAFSIAGLSKFLEGRALYMADNEEAAIAACEEARNFRRGQQELSEVAEIDAFLGEIYSYLGNYSESVNLLRNCLVIADATSSGKVPYYCFKLGNALIDQGELLEAREHLERARVLYSEREDHAWVADCCYSISRTYRGPEGLDDALNLTRTAASLWDAIGYNRAYLSALQRIAILLYSKEEYYSSIENNRRIMEITKDFTEHSENADAYGWALLRMVDCYRVLDEDQTSLDFMDSTDLFGPESTHGANLWFYSLKARALFSLNRHEEALGVADTGLSLTGNDDVSDWTASLYAVKAEVSMEQNRPDKERHLAHAIALLLAFDRPIQASKLSEYFKPDFSPKKQDNILTDETTDSSRGEERPGFGFTVS
jgi:tetratricopeptide (TPR) repeat protein